MTTKLLKLASPFRIAVATAALLGMAQPALADSLNLYGWWGGYQWNASMTLEAGLVNYHDGSSISSTVQAGPFGAGGFTTINDTTHTSFQSWCTDVFHDFYFNSSTSRGNAVLTNAAAMFGAAKAYDLGRLATEALPLVAGHNSSNVNSSAFQLAVWEIVNENRGNYDLYSGNFRAAAGNGATAVAQGWLNALPATSDYSANVWAMQNNGPRGWGPQDVLTFAAVPEPETYALLMAGLGVVGAFARRRRQQKIV